MELKNIYYIYFIQNEINNKIYVGQTTSRVEIRWSREKQQLRKGNFNLCKKHHLQQSWDKYGEENFTWYVVYQCDNQEELDYMEEFYRLSIVHHCTEDGKEINMSYNHREGGGRGKLSEETKKKISEGLRGKIRKKCCTIRKKCCTIKRKGFSPSEQTRKKISQTHIERGIKPPSRKGIPMSEETKNKCRETRNKNKSIILGA